MDWNLFGPPKMSTGIEATPVHHEESMTFNVDGQWVNLPSVINGKKHTSQQILRMYREGKLQPLDGMTHKDMPSAVNHAIERSAAYPNPEEE